MQTNENQHPLSDAEKIVEENFKGLHALIEDEDNLLFYKELIANCLEGFADSKTETLLNENERLIKKNADLVIQLSSIKAVIDNYNQ